MSAPVLRASNVGVRFGARQVLSGAMVDVAAGERVALLGANGSGKTTLLRVLSGALRPDAGEVQVDGRPLRHGRAGLRAHRQAVQLVAQDPDDQLFAADVFRDVSFGPMNLGLGEAEVRARVAQALAWLSITDLAERPIHELSFGQRKRVAIAGALAMRPRVLLLDEPTAGLDPDGVAELIAALDSLVSAGTAVVLATHDVDLAWAWAGQVAVLRDGVAHVGLVVDVLTDADLLASARLRSPLLWQVASGLGLEPSAARDVSGLLAAVHAPVADVSHG